MITEHLDDPGSFEIHLDPSLADVSEVLGSVVEFGHIIVTRTWVNHPEAYSEADFLAAADYTGVVLETEWEGEGPTIHGAGLVWWLASDETQSIIKQTTTYSGASLSTILSAQPTGILPDAITAGTITTTDLGTFTGTFYPGDSCLDALRTVMDDLDAHYRINPDGTIDACSASRDEVYVVTSPRVVMVRRGFGTDPAYVGVEPSKMLTRRNAWSWANRANIVETAYDGTRSISSFKTRAPNPYFDLHGNAAERHVNLTRPVSDVINVDTYLSTHLENFDAFGEQEVDTDRYEFSDSYEPGDWIYAFDPPSGFVGDGTTQITFRGMTFSPLAVQMIQRRRPTLEGMGYYYRPGGASITTEDYIDLTHYVKAEA